MLNSRACPKFPTYNSDFHRDTNPPAQRSSRPFLLSNELYTYWRYWECDVYDTGLRPQFTV